jgi:hypothetical protein
MRCLNFAAAVAILPISASEAQRLSRPRFCSISPSGRWPRLRPLRSTRGTGSEPGGDSPCRRHQGTRTAIALNTGTDRGVSAQLIGVAANLPSRFTVGLSAVHAGISGIAETADDPQPIGGEMPYGTFVVSLTGARESTRHITSGVALRYRTGEVDDVSRSTFGLDGGVLVDVCSDSMRALACRATVGPGAARPGRLVLRRAVDSRVIGADSTRQARLGYSHRG